MFRGGIPRSMGDFPEFQIQRFPVLGFLATVRSFLPDGLGRISELSPWRGNEQELDFAFPPFSFPPLSFSHPSAGQRPPPASACQHGRALIGAALPPWPWGPSVSWCRQFLFSRGEPATNCSSQYLSRSEQRAHMLYEEIPSTYEEMPYARKSCMSGNTEYVRGNTL